MVQSLPSPLSRCLPKQGADLASTTRRSHLAHMYTHIAQIARDDRIARIARISYTFRSENGRCKNHHGTWPWHSLDLLAPIEANASGLRNATKWLSRVRVSHCSHRYAQPITFRCVDGRAEGRGAVRNAERHVKFTSS
jgi:hypothetical protein